MQKDNDNKSGKEKDKLNGQNATAIDKLKEKHKQEKVTEAHDAAEEDIAKDPDLSIHSPNDDLDEGETARLGDDEDLPV